MTDGEGYYSVPEELYEVGDVIELSVNTRDSYEEDYVREANLNTWSHISAFTVEEGHWELPDLDLYSYGREIL